MTIGIIADAHGNIYGLKKCLYLLEKNNVEKIFFLGDAVNYFSKAREVLDFLKHKKVTCIRGNHELLLLRREETTLKKAELYNLAFTKTLLKKEDYKYLSSWNDLIEIKLDNLKVLMVHGSPFNCFDEYVYPDYDFNKFLDLEYDFIFMGHTHIPFVHQIDNKTIVNVGSVGFLRDDGRFISCAVFDITRRTVKLLKDKFPIEDINNLRPFHKEIYKLLERRISKGGRDI